MPSAPPSPDCRVLFFVREPVAGRVKTRLAADLDRAGLPDAQALAARLYAAFGRDMLAGLRSTGLVVDVLHDPPGAGPAVRSWLGVADSRPQPDGDLGVRMAGAFTEVFASGATSALLVGSDLPDLPPATIRQAAQALQTRAVVFGPAADGGYFLVGFRRDGFLPQLFTDMPWSTPQVLALTLARLGSLGLTPALTPGWRDVDTLDDLLALEQRLEHAPHGAPRTADILRQLRGQGLLPGR